MRIPTFAPVGTDLSPRLERNRRGRDLVVGDIHGHFATLRRALAELEIREHDRVFSLGDLVDRGPDSWQAKDWIEGTDPKTRFDLVLRGNHEQLMLEAMAEGPRPRYMGRDRGAWDRWRMNGGTWWRPRSPEDGATAWMKALRTLPLRVKRLYGQPSPGQRHPDLH